MKKSPGAYFILPLFTCMIFLACQENQSNVSNKPKVIVSTDIGGSDPDDFQSMVHLLVYADRFDILGLISSPPHEGRKKHIEKAITSYSLDYEHLKSRGDFPTPAMLLKVTKQGATDAQAGETPDEVSPGAAWIIEKVKENQGVPVWVLVWGSITDVAQAVHQAPEIKKNLRVYSIGSWNTRQDPLSRDYLFNQHPDLWWIENNTTFRGMYMGGYQENDYGNSSFVEQNIKDHGALGALFWEQKKDIKMGDTPSVLYLLNGDTDDPTSASWGGAFVATNHGPNYYTDNPADSLAENNRPGARTVNQHRKSYLDEWAERMDWLME